MTEHASLTSEKTAMRIDEARLRERLSVHSGAAAEHVLPARAFHMAFNEPAKCLAPTLARYQVLDILAAYQ